MTTRVRPPRLRALLPALALAAGAAGCGPSQPQVELRTELGTIRIEVDSARAPATAANFLRYVREGRYEGATFYRVRRDPVQLMQPPTGIVQGGLWYGDSTRLLPPVRFESTQRTGLRHTDGTVSMARFEELDGARAEFFVTLGEQPHLDFRGPGKEGYAAFGRVTAGMEVVRAIRDLPATGERLRTPIRFTAEMVQ
ncbi:MAG TPA: peptidylprolyl isomerase [Longimicrobiaceae bacterium]